MTLAITTTVGQWHEARGRALIHAFATYTGSTAHVSPPERPAALDTVYSRNGTLVAVAEAKTRCGRYDFAWMQKEGSYLVTEEKLSSLLTTGRSLGVPSFLLLELSDGARLYWRIGSADGEPDVQWTAADSRTLATSVDDKTVIRRNAYLPMARAIRWGQAPLDKPQDTL